MMPQPRNEPRKAPSEPSFTKAQLMRSKANVFPNDVMEIVLADNKNYTKNQVAKLVSDFLKRKV